MIKDFFAKTLILNLGLIIVLSGCQTTSEGRTSSDVNGRNLGKTNWRTIPRIESKISIKGDDSIIASRRAQSLPSRYQEALIFKGGGSLFFEELYASQFAQSDQNNYLINTIGRQLKNFGLTLEEKDIKSTNKLRQGSMIYAFKGDETRNCFLFNGHMGVGTYGVGDKHVSGRVCQFKTNPFAQNLEENMLDLISRLEFDGGVINKAKGPAANDIIKNSNSNSNWQKVTVKWAGQPNLTTGKILIIYGNSNRAGLKMSFNNSKETCDGSAERTSQSTGTWELKCSNNKSGTGEFTSLGAGQGAKGVGRDSDGKIFDFEIGPKL